MRVAIAHDYLTQRGGAERVVLSLMRAFPEADLHTMLFDPAQTFPEFDGRKIHVSALNRFKWFRDDHTRALPALPLAAQRMHIDADVVVASSSGWAHAFRTNGRKLVYCHTPARWLYERSDYLGVSNGSLVRRWGSAVISPALREWDRRAAATVDCYIANSLVTQSRLLSAYGAEAPVIHPPHGVDESGPRTPLELPRGWHSSGGFLLAVSRLLPYKNIDQIVLAARALDMELVVVGKGPAAESLKALADKRTLLLENVDDANLRWLYANATALVAASREDFGLTPVEAAVFGTPTVALRAGGYLETVVEGVTGLFFESPNAVSIADAIKRLDGVVWDRARIRAHASTFSEAGFASSIKDRVLGLVGDA